MIEPSNFVKPLTYKDFFPGQSPETKEWYAHRFGKLFLYKFYPYFLSLFRLNKVPDNKELIRTWFTFKVKKRTGKWIYRVDGSIQRTGVKFG